MATRRRRGAHEGEAADVGEDRDESRVPFSFFLGERGTEYVGRFVRM